MADQERINNLTVSRYDSDQNLFYLKDSETNIENKTVYCSIKLKGRVNDLDRTVNTNLELSDYEVFRFINPYLNAQSDLFKLKLSSGNNDRTIGYIIPFNALDDSDNNDDFDESKQAYKYYCIKYIIENYVFQDPNSTESLTLSELTDQNSIFIILYKPQINNPDFRLGFCLPNLALYGYYHYPNDSSPNILEYNSNQQTAADLADLIQNRFLFLRGQQSLKIKTSLTVLDNSLMGRMLYEKLLVEVSNPLHRFILLYQVIEHLVSLKIREGINTVFSIKDSLTNREVLEKIHEKSSARACINSILNNINFNEKDEIKNVLKDFISEYNSNYEKETPGDCLYDIRNLLFHDYKSILEKNADTDLTSLVIQCETLIHHIIISIDNP